MQRFLSTFPGGSAGTGLFLLRLGVATALLVYSGMSLAGHHANWVISAGGLMAASSGGLLLIGLLTRVAALVAALGAGTVLLSWVPSPTLNAFHIGLTPLLVFLVAAAIALLGPGAFSLDAALFGRREIVIPKRPEAPEA